MTDQNPLLISLISAGITLVLAIFAGFSLWRLRKLRNNFTLKDQPVNLEEILGGLAVKIRDLEREHLNTENIIAEIRHHLTLPIQKVGVVRFNSLSNEGGNLSFVIALLDNDNNGFTITSMHARDHARVYTKVINQGVSESQLTEEEIQAVTQAQSSWQTRLKH